MKARIAGFVLAALSLTATAALAADIRVYSGGAPKEALVVLTPEFEKQTRHTVHYTYAVISELQKKFAAGERPDMVLMPAPAIEALIKAGVLKGEPRPILGSTGIGVIVRKGAAHPDISTPDNVRNALLAARSIVHANPQATPSGAHLARVTEQLGLTEALKPKVVYSNALDGGAALVSKGEAEIGIYPISEIISVEGVAVVGPLPRELQSLITYGAALVADNASPEPAQAFIKFLADPANRRHWSKAGFEPPSGG
jgi:molybdate transport system substrate-binding protein